MRRLPRNLSILALLLATASAHAQPFVWLSVSWSELARVALARVPVTIGLLVDGRLVDQVRVRIWTEGIVRDGVWLPMIEK